MAHRTSKGGTYRIDRRFPGLESDGKGNRIAVASGATTKRGLNERNALLTRLYDRARLDILRAIRDHRVTTTEVLFADREGKLDELLGRRVLSRPFWDTVDQWCVGARRNTSKARYAASFARLRLSLPNLRTIRDLENVPWTELKERWPNGACDWNHLRRSIGKFLSVYLGVHDPFRLLVMKAIPKAREKARVPDLTPALFHRLLHAIPERFRAAYMVLAATGLRVGEYLALQKHHLKPNTLSIDGPGTKTAASADTIPVHERLWPWVVASVPAPLQYKWLRIYFKRACEQVGSPELRLHDLRHACGQWLVDAGRPEASVQQTLRHSTADMTRRYTMQRNRGMDAQAMADILVPQSVPKPKEGLA
jgi:integrase